MNPEEVIGKYVAYDSPQGNGFCWAKVKGVFRQPQQDGNLKEFLLVNDLIIGEFVKSSTVKVDKEGQTQVVLSGLDMRDHIQQRHIQGDRLLHWCRLEKEALFFEDNEFSSDEIVDELYLAFLGVKNRIPIRAIEAGLQNISEENKKAMRGLNDEQENLRGLQKI